MLSHLDELESYPKLYNRRKECIQLIETGEIIQCLVYILTSFRDELLDLPHQDSYSSKGDHGLPYVARYLRDESLNFSDVKY